MLEYMIMQAGSGTGLEAITDLVLYGLLAVAGLAFVAMLSQVGLSYLAQRNQNDMFAQALEARAGERAIDAVGGDDDN